MSKLSFDLGSAAAIGGYIAAFVGAILYAFSRQPKQTIANYKELAESQEKRITALEAQATIDYQNHIDNIKAIADLQGQIKVYKELPLQEMAAAMQDISTVNQGIAKSNQMILDKLNSQTGAVVRPKSAKTG